MPSQQEVRWSQLKVGVLVLVAVVALIALIFLMSGPTGGFFSHKVTLRSFFENSAGLKQGAPVNLQGVTIGNVKQIRIVTSNKQHPVEVVMSIAPGFLPDLHTDSTASLVTIGVLGDTVVEINSTRATGPPPENDAVLPANETPNLSDVIRSSQGTIDQVNEILTKVNVLIGALNSNKGSVGQLINSPELYDKAIETISQMQQLVNEVGNGKGSVGKLLSDDTLYNRINDMAGRLDHITQEIDNGQGTIGKLVKDQALADNLNRTVSNANEMLARINAGQGGLGMIANDPKFAAKLSDTLNRMDSLLTRIDNGQGTVGKLIQDPSVYDNTDQMLVESRGLIKAIRENPKKYLTFRVKIF